jgi:hypothetical protein
MGNVITEEKKEREVRNAYLALVSALDLTSKRGWGIWIPMPMQPRLK